MGEFEYQHGDHPKGCICIYCRCAEAEARIERLRIYKQFVKECYGYEFENWKRGRS